MGGWSWIMFRSKYCLRNAAFGFMFCTLISLLVVGNISDMYHPTPSFFFYDD